ncbi:myb domain protein 109 [Striga asiatica]|uniref:Myb domain protein 109 n=1 Tax=Striga asiatica TaxID=4170 RepID=A0A5A7RF92_STRAF|nr:myb domain protein 109 [Striga asiatica]
MEIDFQSAEVCGDGGAGEDCEAALADGDGRASKRSLDRVRGPWSPDEDVMLSQLVSSFGARNWSLIARGIPGRSGKSCRLRWCNQLDHAVKRKPTDEEDRIILQAHAIHGMNLQRSKSEISNEESVEKSKASSEETLSCGDENANSFKSSEGNDVTSLEQVINGDKNHQEKPIVPPTLIRPVAQVSAFTVYNQFEVGPVQTPFVQTSKPKLGIFKLIKEGYNELLIPYKCGHGSWEAFSEVKSLLGPDFVDYTVSILHEP